MRATKSVAQEHHSEILRRLLDCCLTMTYNAIDYAEDHSIASRKGMKGFYRSQKRIDLPSYYKAASIARACLILKSREKSNERGIKTSHRKPLKPGVTIMGGFFATVTGKLFISLGHDKYEVVQLSRYAYGKISEEGMKVRSLTIVPNLVSVCYSKEVDAIPIKTVYGIDRNEKNLTFGNTQEVVQVDLSRIVKVRETTREIVSSFRRNDARIRRGLSSKYWGRARHKTDQMLHDGASFIVRPAAEDQAALALEDLTGIDRLYRRGNGKGADCRFRMSLWPHSKMYRMVEYKAAWKGVTVIRLTKTETWGSSSTHVCGERLLRPIRGDMEHGRKLWCPRCKVWTDRDVNAAVVLSLRGLARLASSLPRQAHDSSAGEKGLAVEAMRGNQTTPAILLVDASKGSINWNSARLDVTR